MDLRDVHSAQVLLQLRSSSALPESATAVGRAEILHPSPDSCVRQTEKRMSTRGRNKCRASSLHPTTVPGRKSLSVQSEPAPIYLLEVVVSVRGSVSMAWAGQ
ncbi:unnamed protein product [Ectocarpus sp. 6 AP-2014]